MQMLSSKITPSFEERKSSVNRILSLRWMISSNDFFSNSSI